MPKSLVELCRDLAWSQWTALGVSGRAAEPSTAIELESAIVFAAELEEVDPRLHAEVLDWCIQFADEFVSVSVLKHVVRRFESTHFDRFAAIVNSQAGTKWPTNTTTGVKFRRSGKSVCRIDRPAAIALRARKIFGINARADVLVELALHPFGPRPTWSRVSSFNELGYTKRNVSSALRDLQIGGVLDTLTIGNSLRYKLRSLEVAQLLAPLPIQASVAWGAKLALAAGLIAVQRKTANKSAVTIAVEIKKLLERHATLLPIVIVDPHDPWRSIDTWLEPWLAP